MKTATDEIITNHKKMKCKKRRNNRRKYPKTRKAKLGLTLREYS